MAVVWAIFGQGGWLQSRRIGDGTSILFDFIFFLWLIFTATLIDP
jgi:hypothetical protein